jgi:hypothetical protein
MSEEAKALFHTLLADYVAAAGFHCRDTDDDEDEQDDKDGEDDTPSPGETVGRA